MVGESSKSDQHYVRLEHTTKAVGVMGEGGFPPPPPTFLELTYSENRVGHSENHGNNSITKF